ncbi:MAG TPA: glycosyltransferase [Gaiellaceae bacterium]
MRLRHARRRTHAASSAGRAKGPAFLCVGSLIERKNVVRLADAFARLGRGRLAFVGDGPLRAELEGRGGVLIRGRITQAEVPAWVAACDVLCQPSTIEPFGQATLEAMAMERTVVATTVGGPPEFVAPEAGVLVDPAGTGAIAAGLERAAALPSPNPAGRAAAAEHDVRTVLGVRKSIILSGRPAKPSIETGISRISLRALMTPPGSAGA